MVLLARNITTSKAGLMPIKKIFYASYQGALQGSEIDQTFLHIARRARGSIWYSTKGSKHYKQGTQSLQLPGINCPLPTRDQDTPPGVGYSSQQVPVSKAIFWNRLYQPACAPGKQQREQLTWVCCDTSYSKLSSIQQHGHFHNHSQKEKQ